MCKTIERPIKARYHAGALSENLTCLFWAESDHRKEFFTKDAFESFETLADLMGYTVERKQKETENA